MAQKSMFRRILSPRNKPDVENKDRHVQRKSYTAGTFPSNGHDSNEEVTRIENSAYGDPEAVSAPPISRTSIGDNPPLPPRNINIRPASMGHHPDDESPMYSAPADTLKKGLVNPNFNAPQAETRPAVKDPYTMGAVPTRTEQRQMQLHQLTMSQKRDQLEDPGHSRARSVGHVIDSSDYSTPFDLQQQMRKASAPPPKPPHTRIKQATGTFSEGDIIPVTSPPPTILSDRDQSNSPSSPLSTPTSEQEITYPPDDGTNDYDEPWDRKFRIPQFNRHRKRHDNIDDSEHHHHNHARESPPHPHSSRHHHSQTHEEVSLKGGSSMKERASSPAFEIHPKSISAKGDHNWGPVRKISPQPPEVPADLNRPPLPRRVKPREGSTSPIQVGPGGRVQQVQQQFHSRSYSQSQNYRREHASDFPMDRTSSMSVQNRKLPSPPMEQPPPLPPSQPPPPMDHRRTSRNASPPTSMIIDTSIPLSDQP